MEQPMSTITDPNYYRPHAVLRDVYAACNRDDRQAAKQAFARFDANDIPNATTGEEPDAMTRMALQPMLHCIDSEIQSPIGDLKVAAKLADEALDNLTRILPQFRIVLIDETKSLLEDANDQLAKAVGKVWSAYLYDEALPVYVSEPKMSYAMHYLYSSAENVLPEALRDMLFEHADLGTGSPSYAPCEDIDAIGWDRKMCCQPQMPTARDYEELLEHEISHYRNVEDEEQPIQVPASPHYPLKPMEGVVRQAMTACFYGNPWVARAMVDVALDALPKRPWEFVKRDRKTLEEVADRLRLDKDDPTDWGPVELQSALNRNKSQAEIEMRDFDTELFASVPLLGVVGQYDGLGDTTPRVLMQLQHAILRGGFVEAYGGLTHQAVDLIKKLPSADRWMKYVRTYDIS